ncbi:MAG: tetratricopeptide repeat protein [Syntrophorhabdaceae bacterium]|nr:tetratricopeptide repeat protein [Syntrophorhabdaceae bacterium]
MRHIATAVLLSIVIILAGCSGSGDNEPTAKDYYKKAYQFIDAGYPGEAIDLLNIAIKKDPNYFDAYYNRGVVHYLMKNYRAAIDDLSKAISIDPNSSEAYASRGEVYEIMNDGEKAFNDYKRAARMGNKGAQDYLRSKNASW